MTCPGSPSNVTVTSPSDGQPGPDSVASRGKVIIDGYNLIAVDALNVSWRDFRFGKQQTLDLLKASVEKRLE